MSRKQLSSESILDIWQNNFRDAYYIAKRYGVSPWLVYDRLKKYCAQTNINYQDVLRHPEKAHKTYKRKVKENNWRKDKMYYIKNIKFSLKDLRCAETNGATIPELASKFDISEEEFLLELEKITKNDFSEHKRILEKNAKIHKKHSKITKEENDDNMEKVEIKEVIATEKVKSNRESELENAINNLKNNILELTTSVNQQENIIRLTNSEIDKIKNELVQIAETVKEKQKALMASEAQKTKIEEKILELKAEISQKEDILTKAEIEFEAYKAIVISFRENTIEISKDDYSPSAKDIEEKSSELLKLEVFDDYAAKHIKKAAEVLCAVDYIKVMELKYSIDYENCPPLVKEILEEVFSAA